MLKKLLKFTSLYLLLGVIVAAIYRYYGQESNLASLGIVALAWPLVVVGWIYMVLLLVRV